MRRGAGDLAEHLGGSEPITPYTCRILAGSRRKYRSLCKQLRATGLLRFALEPRPTVGIFFVKKKTPGTLRLILDARLTNQLMKLPPGVCLAGAEAPARIETQLPNGIESDSLEAEELLRHFCFSLSTADVADAFHRLRISQELAEYFSFPWSLPAREFGLGGSVVSG